jgi:hypothetical protein|tara:strand:- start:663 stop:884 length:222 start_codon:yes stop_codon:yes gene_type:complete
MVDFFVPTDGNDPAMPAGMESGLTKREHFAGLALQGILSNCYYQEYTNRDRHNELAHEAVLFSETLMEFLGNK